VDDHAEGSLIGDLLSYQEGAVVSRMIIKMTFYSRGRYSGKWLQARDVNQPRQPDPLGVGD
jgi:hypothetical protein